MLSSEHFNGDDEPPIRNDGRLNVDEELQSNTQALHQMDAVGVQDYLDALDARDPVLSAPDDTELCICCMDPRQRSGKSHGSPGVGVLLDAEGRSRIATSLVDQAETMWKNNGRKTVTINVRHHGKDTCAAAAKALADAGTPAKNPGDIDAKAAQGSADLAEATRHEIGRRNLDGKITVSSGQYPHESFLQTQRNQPTGGGALVSLDPSLVYNLSRKKGPLFYNISSLAGDEVAMVEAFLAAQVAFQCGFGASDRLPFRIILAGPQSDVTRLAARYERELETNAAYKALRGRVKIEGWVRGR